MKYFWLYLVFYLLFINLIAAAVCAYDKIKAQRHEWRISENFLFFLCILGGSVGMYLTMLRVRHKTKHPKFMIGIPVMIAIQAIILLKFIFWG